MEVRTGTAAAQANVADDVAAPHVLAGGDGEAGKVPEASDDSTAMFDDDRAAIAAQVVGEIDYPIRRRNHRLADNGGDIDSGVEGALTVKWIDALPE